jgi:predicted  nucleic acid-binding Zn-ribbon protein
MSDTEKVNKTKLLLALKTEITDVKQALDAEKTQVDKLQKRLAQVGPALDDIRKR